MINQKCQDNDTMIMPLSIITCEPQEDQLLERKQVTCTTNMINPFYAGRNGLTKLCMLLLEGGEVVGGMVDSRASSRREDLVAGNSPLWMVCIYC